jgi:hypothetical protein
VGYCADCPLLRKYQQRTLCLEAATILDLGRSDGSEQLLTESLQKPVTNSMDIESHSCGNND